MRRRARRSARREVTLVPLVSVTRLRLRSILFLLPFALRAGDSTRQAMRAPGCQGVLTRKTRGLAFWTLTMWDDETSMRIFVTQSPHREVMPRLSRWCDEASVAHWTQESGAMPAWSAATQVLLERGRLLRVAHPSEMHREGQINVT
jgi:heme-degrading monooxygenase HmoA